MLSILLAVLSLDVAVTNICEIPKLPVVAYSNQVGFALSGTVLLVNDTGFALQDGSDAIWVRKPKGNTPDLQPGAVVAVRGHLFINNTENDKQATSVTLLERHLPPEPIDINYEGIRTGRYAYRQARASGIIVSALKDEMDGDYNWLTLRTSDGAIQIATTEADLPLSQARDLIGSEVSVRGTVMRSSAWANSYIHYLSLSTSGGEASIDVLRRPPWLTRGKLLAIISALCLLLVAVLVWNASLRILSVRRARQLFGEQIRRAESELKNEERTRLAIELHDSVSQNLSAVTMEIESAKRLAANADPRLGHLLDLAWRTLHTTRDELRNCLFDLRGKTLEEKDLPAAIRSTLTPHLGSQQVHIRFPVRRELLSDSSAHAILSIIRELVLNGLKHGHAQAFHVAGSIEDGRLLFSVRDDGSGFDPESAPGIREGHFGLQGIRCRVERLNGAFRIESKPGSGTRAVVSVPLPNHEKDRK